MKKSSVFTHQFSAIPPTDAPSAPFERIMQYCPKYFYCRQHAHEAAPRERPSKRLTFPVRGYKIDERKACGPVLDSIASGIRRMHAGGSAP